MATKVTKSTSSSRGQTKEFEKDISKKRNWFTVLLLIIWWPIKIILYPFIWVLKEFRRMASFLTNRSDAPLDFEEIALVESVPVFFTLASLDLAIILGIIASIGFSDKVKKFIGNFTQGLSGISLMVGNITDLFVSLVSGIYDLIVHGLIEGSWNILTSIHYDPIFLLIGAGVLSIVIVVLIMIISELNVINKLMRKLGYFGLGIAELPFAIYESLDHFWMRFLKTFGRLISGKFIVSEKRSFYRRIIVFVTLYALWTFIWGILILLSSLLDPTAQQQLGEQSFLYKTIWYMLIVIFASGFLAGTVLMYFLSKILKMITKTRYNAEKELIEKVRHQSLLNYFSTKERVASLALADVARLVDISKYEMINHFKDKTLGDWILSGNAIVNDKLYKERLEYVDGLVDKGLDEEDVKTLIKALDYLSFMEKGLRNVPDYVSDLEDRKQLINEDIADVRGLYGTTTQPEGV